LLLYQQNEDQQQQIIKETFQLVSKREDSVCNFLEYPGSLLIDNTTSDCKLIYRHYATLYFVFCVDSSESELGILDLIQVFVETLDKCFENVCELDLIFHADSVHHILNELVMGGMVLQTNMNEILARIEDQNKIQKAEVKIILFFYFNIIYLLMEKSGWTLGKLWGVSCGVCDEKHQFTNDQGQGYGLPRKIARLQILTSRFGASFSTIQLLIFKCRRNESLSI
jgi:hypothetical protein